MPPLHPAPTRMRGLSGMGRTRPLPRAVRGFVLAAGTLMLLLIMGSPVVQANPPRGPQYGWLELNPTHGRATVQVNTNYWYIDPLGLPCPATVRYLWDAKP